ncbi:tetratricopeptide repeat protein [Marinicella gelatinilytica]|uniref:tetratricopeptide repeat protein n=1 Tax=Marinicella gelatinilytica TaxID=2996017 RepID=UPI002260FDD7|nr:tetratricopeptide repeat protein [Marinicella gelatinilytica]MCX7545736.1 hypothetical protein [Marinicella gelatinilytica]
MKMSFFVALVCLLITACSPVKTYQVTSHHKTADLFNDAIMMPEVETAPLDLVFYLNGIQKDAFKKELRKPSNRTKLDIEIIYQYLQERLQHFNFYSETLTAEQAITQNAGNCLTLAILTNALANTTNVGVYYELARTPPVFQRENGYLLSSQHIQTVIFEKKVGGIFYSSKPLELKIDYYSTAGSRTLRRVSVEEFQSMYYSNVAAESLIKGDSNVAYWNLKKALRIDPDNPIALNMLAVLYRNMGYDQYAERVFVHGLSLAKNQLELLSNYHHYLIEKGRQQEAAQVAVVIDDYHDPDPFKWIDMADQALFDGRYQQAVKYYKKAHNQAPYLDEPSAGLAKAYFFLGDQSKAVTAIEQALDNSHSKSKTTLYQAKYDYLKSQLK